MSQLLNKLYRNPLLQRYQLFILPIFSLIVCILLLVFIITPQVLKLISANKAIAEAQQKYYFFNSKVNILEKIDTSIYKDNLNIALLALPDDQDIPGALGQILFLLSSNRLKLSSMSFSGFAKGSKTVGDYQIKIDVGGDTSSLKDFITKLNESPRIMKVVGLEVTEEKRGGRLHASLTLQAFFQPLPTSLGDIEQTVVQPSSKDTEILNRIESYARLVPVFIGSEVTGVKGKLDPFQ